MQDPLTAPTDAHGLLSEQGLRSIFAEFPLALALVEAPDGQRLVNQRFEALLGASALESGPLLELLLAPGEPWRLLSLTSSTGAVVDVRARAQRLAFGVLLLVEESPVADEVVASLRTRVTALERLSATDPLTGAWNRAHLDRTVEAELSRSVRFRQPLSLVLLDVDHFKQVNDGFGHQTGDAVLRALVALLRETIRGADLLFRWGGEEFVVLAPSTGHRAAVLFAEKLRAAVEAHPFALVGRVTVSAGVAEHLGAESAADWFQRLDACLYQAKRAGRNRVSSDSRGSSDAWLRAGGAGTALRLQWSEAYESGDPLIDTQHHELFDLANDLIEASSQRPRSLPATAAAFGRLLAHIEVHFRDEEALLGRLGYPKLESHARAHARILGKAQELGREADAGTEQFGEVVDFLANEVVARHLFAADRDFFPLILRGPSPA